MLTSKNGHIKENMLEHTNATTFESFVSLHHLVNISSPNTIKHIFHTLNSNLLKQLLLIYIQYFFNLSNRNKTLHSHNGIHKQITKQIKTELISRKVQKQVYKNQVTTSDDSGYKSPFSKLHKLLISHIFSFCSFNSRIKSSQTCHYLFNSANQQIAKYHLKINRSFVQNLLIHDNTYNHIFDIAKYKNFRCIHLAGLYNGANNRKRINFINNLTSILQQSSGTLVKFECNIDRQCSNDTIIKLQKYICNIKALKMHNQQFNKIIFNNLNQLQVTQQMDLQDIQHLWINAGHSTMSSSTNIQIENNICRYILPNNYSKLTHLSLNVDNFNLSDIKCLNKPHPFFWLWNISTLQYCSLNMTLPIAKDLEIECEKLLKSNIVLNKRKKQKQFTTLDINIRDIQYVAKTSYYSLVSHGAGDVLRTPQQNQHTSTDVKTLLQYIRILYPNLLHISADIYFRVTRHLCINNWKNLFRGLITIKMTLPSINNVTCFLNEILESQKINDYAFNKLENLVIYGIHPCTSIETIIENENSQSYKVINDKMNGFIDNICNFIKYKPNKLHAFEVLMHHYGDSKYKCLKTSYWNVYYKLLEYILGLIESENGKYIMDGIIRLDLPYVDIWTKSKPEHCWYYGDYHWTKENENESLKIAQVITKIQLAMNRYNNKIKYDEMNKQLILHLGSLVLRYTHDKFLEFWFNGDDILYNTTVGKRFVFI